MKSIKIAARTKAIARRVREIESERRNSRRELLTAIAADVKKHAGVKARIAATFVTRPHPLIREPLPLPPDVQERSQTFIIQDGCSFIVGVWDDVTQTCYVSEIIDSGECAYA